MLLSAEHSWHALLIICVLSHLQDDPKLYENHTCGPPRTPTAADSEPPRKRARIGKVEEHSHAAVRPHWLLWYAVRLALCI
jgi:hypothetical protein